jgi:general secretion pathway protein A
VLSQVSPAPSNDGKERRVKNLRAEVKLVPENKVHNIMYTEHFGLNILPFENVPDPAFFFDEGDYARIDSSIKHSVIAGRDLMIVTGPVGSGKTTLSQMIISKFSKERKIIWMAIPPVDTTEFFLFIAQELGLQISSLKKHILSMKLLMDIREALLKIISEDNKCILIIDESHCISDDTIKGISLLCNLEEGSIQVLLLGQKELMETIKRPEMESFKQRISTLETLDKMNAESIGNYVSHRLKVAGGQPSIFTDTGWKALILALKSGGVPRIINLLCDVSLQAAFDRKKRACDVDDIYKAAERIGIGKEVFHYKVSLNQKVETKKAPANDADVKAGTMYGATPVICTCAEGQTEASEMLLESGTDVNDKKGNGRTALMDASIQGNLDLVNVLLSHGADVNMKDFYGLSSLIYASNEGHTEIVKTLLTHSADVNMQDNSYGMTALIYASFNGYKEIVEILLCKGADLNATDNTVVTPLMSAAINNHANIVELLLSKGADVNAKTVQGLTALKVASEENLSDIERLLRQAGAKDD